MGKGCHRDPVLALLTKLNQVPIFVQERMEHSEVTYSPWLSSAVF